LGLQPAGAIDGPEIASAEADDRVAGLEFGEPDPFAGQRLADEDELAPPFDLCARGRPSRRVIGVAPGVFDAFGRGKCTTPLGIALALF
jgi:hypothetical protein